MMARKIKDKSQRFSVELIKGAINATRREMEALIARTSMSPFIREKKDFFTAIINKKGELVVSTRLPGIGPGMRVRVNPKSGS